MTTKLLKSFLVPIILAPIMFIAGFASSLPAHAEQIIHNPRAVLELFTSQGCSSCPPADKLLDEFAQQRDDVIALAYHVDYWDYIGWKDTFASPEFAKRQRGYAAQFDSSVYTPQLVVNGRVGMVGSRRGEITRALSATETGQLPELHIPVTLNIEGNMLHINVVSQDKDLAPTTVWAVTFTKAALVDIKRGENRGKTIKYSNIVRSKTPLGMLYKADTQQFKLKVADILRNEADGVAILVQKDKNGLAGPIIGSAVYTK